MAREQIKVPFGYEQPARSHKGSLLIFETFEDWQDADVSALVRLAEARKFVRAIFYPQHEETLRRMGIPCEMPYYARIKHLESMLQDLQSGVTIAVDAWEGKRKKYTPLDTSLHFLTDKYHGPYFIAMSDRYMNLFVTYPSFKEWIKNARFIILPRFGVPLHAKLHDYAERWEVVEMINGIE